MAYNSTSIYDRDSLEAEAIAEARFNSGRLLADARIMFEAGSWGTCISLAILACEESGKFFQLVHHLGTDFCKIAATKNHRKKQNEFARHLRSCLRVRVLEEYFRSQGKTDTREILLAGIEFYDQCLSLTWNSDSPEETVTRDSTLGPIWKIVETRMAEDEVYSIAENAALGLLDATKQKGFYVDVTSDGVASPRQFDKKAAALHLRAAEIVIESITPPNTKSDLPVRMRHVRLAVPNES